MTDPKDDRTYWLDSPRNVAKVFYAVCAICLLLFVADAFYEKKVHFAFEAWFGFFGLYGFIACVGLVLAAKELRKILKRDEDYYDR